VIKFHCDGCTNSIDHPGPEIPAGWAAVVSKIRWAKATTMTPPESVSCSEWEPDNAVHLCPECRGSDGAALEEKSMKGLRDALYTGPRAV
jgi:hypothetical protein